MINPTNEIEAREVLEVEIKSLIVKNFTPSQGPTSNVQPEGYTPARLNATQASKEITDLFIEAYRKLKRNENVTIKNLD
jgi:hypothetical protein